MEKRRLGGADVAPLQRKRQKIVHEAPTGEQVVSSDQLRRLLAFDQDLGRARHGKSEQRHEKRQTLLTRTAGLQSFKLLLDAIVAPADDNGTDKLVLLQHYLNAVQPASSDNDAVALGDVMETWAFAVQVDDEAIMSSVAVVLALVLRITSTSLQLVPHGLAICKTLLQERQLKCLAKNLSVSKGKAFIISPTLRLLREAVCLDGGSFAKSIFGARKYTFASLGRNLELGHVSEDSQHVSIRTNALGFLLDTLKFVHSQARNELLQLKDLLSHVTFMLKTDAPQLVMAVLDALRTHVLMDSKIPRATKLKSFNTKTLVRLLALYTYTKAGHSPDEVEAVREKAHEFLVWACTTPAAGVVCRCKGLYPRAPDDDAHDLRTHDAHPHEAHRGFPVLNLALSDFARKLRPWSSLHHSQLLVAMFAAAPELVADYFHHTSSFTLEPKLSMTWIGYAAFLFDTVSLDLPPAFGDGPCFATAPPPPTNILLDNILPPPLTQKMLVRCFSMSSHLTSLFAARILIAALQKMALACHMHRSSHSRRRDSAWSDAARRLVDAFCQRMPTIKVVVACYNSTPVHKALHRGLMSRLLRLYYEVIPRMTAPSANFNPSPRLSQLVDQLDQGGDTSDTTDCRAWNMVELENMVCIASLSLGMKWFSKLQALSAYTALLRLICRHHDGASSRQFRLVLTDVAVENHIVSPLVGLRPLLRSLQCSAARLGSARMHPVWDFLDNCMRRCAASPTKYVNQTQALLEHALPHDCASFCLLDVVIAQQLPFVVACGHDASLEPLTDFLSLYLNACYMDYQDCDRSLLAIVHGRLRDELPPHLATRLAPLGDTDQVELLGHVNEMALESQDGTPMHVDGSQAAQPEPDACSVLHVAGLSDGQDTSALSRWASKGAEDLIEDGCAAGLIRLLASHHEHIRKEALVNIGKMALRIKESSYEERTQMWLLLSELVESSREQVQTGPVPSVITAFAIHALDVLNTPLHPLYAKVNSFLTRSPLWALDKVPLAHDIVHGAPSTHDGYYKEISWLLTYLLDGLKTPSDLDLLYRKKWLEKVLVLASNAYLRSGLRSRILKLVYRVTCIDGGSTRLVTRLSMLGWLDAQRAACAGRRDDEAALYQALTGRVLATCHEARIDTWKRESLATRLTN